MARSQRSSKLSKPSEPQNFMEFVQVHERTWGTEVYPGRPDLSEILSAPVVAFWKHNDDSGPFRVTLHKDLEEIEKYFLRLIMGAQTEAPKQRLVRVYKDQKRMGVSGVRIIFTETED